MYYTIAHVTAYIWKIGEHVTFFHPPPKKKKMRIAQETRPPWLIVSPDTHVRRSIPAPRPAEALFQRLQLCPPEVQADDHSLFEALKILFVVLCTCWGPNPWDLGPTGDSLVLLYNARHLEILQLVNINDL